MHKKLGTLSSAFMNLPQPISLVLVALSLSTGHEEV